MRTTRYRLMTDRDVKPFTAAVVADLHDHPYDDVLRILERERPDIILIPGDLTEWLADDSSAVFRPGLGLLEKAAGIAPTFYSFGNHEIGAFHRNLHRADEVPRHRRGVSETFRAVIQASGATLLDDAAVTWQGMTIGGIGSGLWHPDRTPRTEWMEAFAARPGYKLLLCHHPEYYARYMKEADIDLIVSGHAHGGQWRIFGRGVYAPDQSLFPRYTSGVHDGRLIISRGVANTVRPIPRFFNPREVVMISVERKG